MISAEDDEDKAWLEKADQDWFRWIVLRDGLDALWAWVINKP